MVVRRFTVYDAVILYSLVTGRPPTSALGLFAPRAYRMSIGEYAKRVVPPKLADSFGSFYSRYPWAPGEERYMYESCASFANRITANSGRGRLMIEAS